MHCFEHSVKTKWQNLLKEKLGTCT